MSKENVTRSPKAQEKFDAKVEKAKKMKSDLAEKINEVRKQILEESDSKKKDELRKERDTLIAQREAIVINDEKVTIPMNPKSKKIITAVVSVVIIVGLLCAYFCTGYVQNGLIAKLGLPQKVFTAYTLVDDEGEKHDIKVSTYNFYFAQTYRGLQSQVQQYTQYGMSEEDLKSANMYVDFDQKLSKQERTEDDKTQTWLEYVQDQVKDQIKSTYVFYYKALADNKGKEPDIKEDQQKEIDDAIDQYKEYADEQGYSVDGYLQAALGDGVTEEVFRRELKISYIAENYQENNAEKLSKTTYAKKDVDKYLKDNAAKLKSVDIKMFECSTEDEAKKFAKALKADGSNFAELASKYASNKFQKNAYKNSVETVYNNITRIQMESMGNAICTVDDHKHSEDEKEDAHKYSGLDWLYSSKRKAGDVKQYSTSIVYVMKPVYTAKQKAVSVRHILIVPEKSKSNTDNHAMNCTAKQWKDADKKAKKILKEFKDGKKQDSDAFAALAKENSEDGSAAQGGLYENIYPNQMVATFNAWAFDSARKPGDTTIVKTMYGYHIMYFENTSDISTQEAYARANLEGKTASELLEDEYEISENWFGSRYFQDDTDIG